MPDYSLSVDTGYLATAGEWNELDTDSRLPVPCPSLEVRPRGYTCQVCMERLFSGDGIALRIDDGLDTETQDLMIEDAIMDATDLINQYCLPIYPESQLAKSRWVSRRACYLACHFLSLRRGNPAQYQARHDMILTELEKVNRLQLHIPRLVVRNEVTPSMSNLIVDDRYYQDSLRVVRSNQVGAVYPDQDADYPMGMCSCGYW